MSDRIVLYPRPSPISPTLEEFSVEEREILGRVNQKVAASESLHDLLGFLFQSTRSICPCDRIGLAFVDEDGARIRADHAVAEYEPILLREGYTEDLAGSSLERVIETGSPRIITDLEAYLDENPSSASTRVILKEGVRSNLTCPLSVDGRRVGVLFRSSRQTNAYGPRQVRLHMAVAERIGQAVEKAYRIRRIEAANRAYFEMLAFVSHELKSPVASMVTDAGLLAGGYLGELEPDQKRKIERIIAKGNHLLGLVREYLDLSRIEGEGVKPKLRRIEDLVQEVIEPSLELVESQIEAKKMRVVREYSEEPLALDGDPDLLRIVLVNLLGNAAKYGDEEKEIRITTRLEPDAVVVSVRNEGPGFPESQREALFQRFSRLNTPELSKRSGTGVGLYTSWRVVQLHRGRIIAESEEGRWASFTVRLPKRTRKPA